MSAERGSSFMETLVRGRILAEKPGRKGRMMKPGYKMRVRLSDALFASDEDRRKRME